MRTPKLIYGLESVGRYACCCLPFPRCLTSLLQVFLAVNRLCVKYFNQTHSSRALEMIVQAHWMECYDARVAAICLENTTSSTTESRMAALKEACSALGWQEKDLRNRMCDLSKTPNSHYLLTRRPQGYMARLQRDQGRRGLGEPHFRWYWSLSLLQVQDRLQ